MVGGFLYLLIELLFRGWTHWSMFLVGGTCFLLIGGLNSWYPWKPSLLRQMFLSALIVTAVEFISGCMINLWLGWNVWDYSHMPFHVLGQISLWFSIAWFFLSLIAIVLDDFLRWMWFGEWFPDYYLLSRKAFRADFS